jgi:hypothetical protein
MFTVIRHSASAREAGRVSVVMALARCVPRLARCVSARTNTRRRKVLFEPARGYAGGDGRLPGMLAGEDPSTSAPGSRSGSARNRDEAQRRGLEVALERTGGNVSLAAARLGIARGTVYAPAEVRAARRAAEGDDERGPTRGGCRRAAAGRDTPFVGATQPRSSNRAARHDMEYGSATRARAGSAGRARLIDAVADERRRRRWTSTAGSAGSASASTPSSSAPTTSTPGSCPG